ncbi:MAG TPA: histidine--tRNA ligase [Candidatus Saccharimonadales bacterium]|nr:histidine--tRNA ligase [Candidatus Saccharimonadales bacterium]
MSLSTQPYKGARDFYPEDKRLQKYMFNKMREVAERFGYEEYDAPILEPTELYLSKGNQEIIDEQTYTFLDRGERSVTIRTEMTPTVSRMVAGKRQELAYPVRWYSIPNLWRYERTQRGRLREFWQFNADIFGVEGVEAEHEAILMAAQIMHTYGARADMYEIQISSRKLVDELFTEYLGLDQTQKDTLIRLIDRMKKMPYETFAAQADSILAPSQSESGVFDKLMQLLKVTKVSQLPEGFASRPSVARLQRLMDMLAASKVGNAKFDITLMRGFDYYTDMVFEVADTDPDNNRSMFGGGRYDGLVGMFGVEPVPTVGFAMGDVTLQNFLESHGLLPQLASETDAYVILPGDNLYDRAQHTVAELRRMGLNIAVDPGNRKIEKQIKTAVKKGIHYAIFIGEEELSTQQYKLRNLVDSTEEVHGLERIVSIAKDRRRAGQIPTDAGDDEDLLA